MEILKKVIPLKIKFLRPNHPNFETKEVKKVIILRIKIRNHSLKKRTLEAGTKYNKQTNIYVSLVKKDK